jgi:hypothetical protein
MNSSIVIEKQKECLHLEKLYFHLQETESQLSHMLDQVRAMNGILTGKSFLSFNLMSLDFFLKS